MSFADLYLSKQNRQHNLPTVPTEDLGIVIAIPCYDEPDLMASLEALWRCERPNCSVEVIVVVNSGERSPESALEQNQKTVSDFARWEKEHNDTKFRFFLIEEKDVRHKFAGVGNARKVAMDAATLRFNQLERPDGIIVGYDADSSCKTNYLVELEKFYRDVQNEGASLFYEHPTEGDEFPASFYSGIIDYELHLRYFVQAQRWAGLPYAFHTVGSSFAVKAFAYCKYGGMNRRKAGEDFYFLQKFIPHGKYININSTSVIPSPRPSDRVPFGTGASIRKMENEDDFSYLTYNFSAFEHIRNFAASRHDFFKKEFERLDLSFLHKSIAEFLQENDFATELSKINEHSPNRKIFDDRFFQWWSAFRVIKYLNWAHSEYFVRKPIGEEASVLLCKISEIQTAEQSNLELLRTYREIERQQ